MINKNIDDVSYPDIEWLAHNKIDESNSLDYKEDMIDDEKLLKHICAFANTRGGDIVFGIRESGKGGHPEEILGIDAIKLDKERIEQIVLSNITPRLVIKIRIIKNTEQSEKAVMIIRIPDSHMKPHQNTKNNKYYKRFQFKSAEMSEQEICDCYKRRFSNRDSVKQYIRDITSRMRTFPPDGIGVEIVMVPSNIDHRIMDTSDYKQLEWIKHVKMRQEWGSRNIFPRFDFCGDGIMHKVSTPIDMEVVVHRNGCVLHRMHFRRQESNYFSEEAVAVMLMQTLHFGNEVLQHYGYFGEVRISVHVTSNSKVILPNVILQGMASFDEKSIDGINCDVSREYALQYVADNYEKMSASIMDEILNHFGKERCTLFNKNGMFNPKI